MAIGTFKSFTNKQRKTIKMWVTTADFFESLPHTERTILSFFHKKKDIKYGPNNTKRLNEIRDKWIVYLKQLEQ